MAKIKELMAALDDEALLEEVQKALEAGTAPAEIIMECQEGMAAIGELFSQGEMFVSDLMMAGAICKEVSDTVKPYMKGEGAAKLGKVVMGTVKNDIHDIGKDIVITMLEASGFEVIDVGVDAPAEAFVRAAQENDAKVIGLSCLLVSCYDSIKETVAAVRAAGLDSKIIIGGGPIDGSVQEYSGADAWAASAQETVNFAKEVLGV